MAHIGTREIGEGRPCFIVFEAGPTHNGLESAKHLVELAAEAGADAVKFQIFDPDKTIVDKTQLFSYEVLVDKESGRRETVSEPLYDIYVRRSMSKEHWRELKAHCDALGLAFFATADTREDVDFLMELGCPTIKISSCDINHFPLIRYAARQGVCLQLDTGSATLGEMEQAVEVLLAEGCNNFLIHLCPSGYPARLESINLNMIPTMQRMFGCPIAFSDHTPGRDMDMAALALGAKLLEKTITTDRSIRSVEHIMSLEPGEMHAFIQAVRDVETALGEERKRLHPQQRKDRVAVKRSVHLREAVKEGQRLGDVDVDFLMPGHGIQPDRYEELLDAAFSRDMSAGTRLSLNDLLLPERM
jgi:sialic acid synthase SpsE